MLCNDQENAEVTFASTRYVRWFAGVFKSEHLDLDNRSEWRKILISGDLDDTTLYTRLSFSLVGVREGGRGLIY